MWDALAGDHNLKFIAMSGFLNSAAKGMFFPDTGGSFVQSFVTDPTWQVPAKGAGWVWGNNGNGNSAPPWSAVASMKTMIVYFERVLYGVLEMRSDNDNMLALIDQTNNRIYLEL